MKIKKNDCSQKVALENVITENENSLFEIIIKFALVENALNLQIRLEIKIN